MLYNPQRSSAPKNILKTLNLKQFAELAVVDDIDAGLNSIYERDHSIEKQLIQVMPHNYKKFC